MYGKNYAAAKLPTYNCNGKKVQMSTYFGYKMLGVNPYSKNKEWAHKFARYISNEENQKLRFEMRGQGPSNINAGKSDEVKNHRQYRQFLNSQNGQNCNVLEEISGHRLQSLERHLQTIP